MNKSVSVLLVFVFISAVSAFWYFGHYRPAEKMRQAPPVKIYKTTSPEQLRAKEIPSVTDTPTSTKTSREGITSTPKEPDVTGEDFSNGPLSSRDAVAPRDTVTDITPVPEQSELPSNEHPPHKHNYSEESKRVSEEVDAALASAEATLEEAGVAIAKMLLSLPVEQQRTKWKQMKENFFTARNPITQELLLTPEQAEEAWQSMVNMIKDAGYIPPQGVEE